MAILTTVFVVTLMTVTSARTVPFTNSEQVPQESQSSNNTDIFTNEPVTVGNIPDQGDQASNLTTNEQEHGETRKAFRNIDTRAYDNLNTKNADKDPNVQGDQYVKSNSHKNRFNSWNKGQDATTHTYVYNDRRNTQNKKQTKVETTEKIRTDSRLGENRDKTTKDNEVTPKTDKIFKKPKDQEDDRWIWPDEAVETTTGSSKGVTFEDRASFAGDNCPTGQVKFNNVCVDID